MVDTGRPSALDVNRSSFHEHIPVIHLDMTAYGLNVARHFGTTPRPTAKMECRVVPGIRIV